MRDLLTDLRYAARMLRKSPVTTLVAILSLGFAIATNTTVFSVASAFLLEGFRWRAVEEIVFLLEVSRSDRLERQVSPGNFLDWKEQSRGLEALEAYRIRPANLSGRDRPERIDMVEATAGLFDLLGTPPALGRGFASEEEDLSGSRVAILTHPFFEHHFGADPSALGSAVAIDGEPHTVIGVLGADFDFFPANVELFRPMALAQSRHDRSSRDLWVLGRLAPGSGVDELQAELAAVAQRLEVEHPETNRGTGVLVRGVRDVFPGRIDTQLQYILLTVGVLVLVIATANLVNLFLAKGDGRREEMALRLALGAGRRRLGRQLLTESVLVGLLGGLVGVAGSIVWVRDMQGFMPAELPEIFHPRFDGLVLVYGVAVSLAAGALLGAAPALQATRVAPASALGETSRGGTASRRRRRLRSGFIVAEVAVALALLTAAGILTDTFERMVQENGSIDVDGVLTLELTADENRFPDDAAVVAFYREVRRRLAELPGVEATTALTTLPRDRAAPRTQVTIDGRPPAADAEAPWTGWQAVSAGYFTTLRVPLVTGRAIAEADRADAPAVVVVNQSFAGIHFPGEEPLGRRITLLGASREIVGVCEDFRQDRIPEVEGRAPAVFVAFEQHPVRTSALAARVDGGDPTALAGAARQAVWRVDPDQPVTKVQSLRQHVETSLAGPRVISQGLRLMGAVALLLAAIGIYGLISHDVAERRREIGIRMALGAAPSAVVCGVTLRGLAIAGIGMALGLPAAWAMERVIAAMFQGWAPVDLSSIAVIALVLAAVAAIASSLPAVRAARIRPAGVLQSE